MIFFLFSVGWIINIQADECLVIKIGKQVTIYNIEDLGNSNYWGEKVSIKKSESTLPGDAYLKNSGAPQAEWEIFMENKNGIYYSVLERSQQDYLDLKKRYQKLLTEKPSSQSSLEELQKAFNILKNQSNTNEKSFNKQIKELRAENDSIIKKYNKLFAHKTHLEWRVNYLIASLIILSLTILFLLLKIKSKNKKLKILETDQRVSNLSS